MLRRRQPNRSTFPLVFLIFCSVFTPLPRFGQQSATLPDWKINEALSKRLETTSSVEEFSIRPPKGYSLQTRLGPEGSKVTAWVGRPRTDGTRPQVMLLTFRLSPGQLKKYFLEKAFDELVASLSYQRSDWSRTAAEKGLLNGLLFVRTRWHGRDQSTGMKMHGFVYVAMVGEMVIQLSSQDVEPHHEEALKLAEASVLTFERSPKVSSKTKEHEWNLS